MTKNSRREKVKVEARKCLIKRFEGFIDFVGLVDFLNSTFSPSTCNEAF